MTHPSFAPSSTATAARLRTAAIIAVLLLAFALRLYHLDFQSLEGDEGISLQRSSQPLGQMLERMPVEHVPGYFVLLNGWLQVTGEEDFALRYLSLMPSVAAVALVYRWSASMGRPGTGLIAALLLATNSFQIWYAQQARMYGWLLMTALLSFWSLWRIVQEVPRAEGVDDKNARWGSADILYILSTTATIYLHYFGFLVPVAQTVFMAIWQASGGLWRTTRRWLLNGVLVFLLFLPWLPSTLTFLGFQGWREPLDAWLVPWTMHRAYSVGFPMPEPWQGWLPWLYLLLGLCGLIAWWRQNRIAWLLLATATFVPWLLILISVLRNPDFHERYALFLTGPWTILMAGGFSIFQWFSRSQRNGEAKRSADLLLNAALPALLVLALVILNGVALNRLYFDTTLHKADYRGAAERILRNEAAGDVILVDGPNPELVFNHYYQDEGAGQAPVYDLRSLTDQDFDEVSKHLQEDTDGARRAWEVLYFHTPGAVQFWLATYGWPSAPSAHNGIRVTLYGLEGGPVMAEEKIAIPFGDGLTLQQAEVDGPTMTAGDLLRVTTHWQVDAPLPDYKFSLRLLAPDGQALIADDYMPQNWFTTTSQWAPGEAIDRRALYLPAELPPGSYQVTMRLYDPANGVAVDTPAGQDVQLGTVEVIHGN